MWSMIREGIGQTQRKGEIKEGERDLIQGTEVEILGMKGEQWHCCLKL